MLAKDNAHVFTGEEDLKGVVQEIAICGGFLGRLAPVESM